MNRRFYQRCLLWLLPLLVVHSLVPVGFMVTTGDRGLEIAFCPVQSAPLVKALAQMRDQDETSHASHAGHREAGVALHGSDHPEHSQHDRSTSCPFSLAGAEVLAVSAPSITVTFIHLDSARLSELAAPPSAVLFERNRIRGPPRLA